MPRPCRDDDDGGGGGGDDDDNNRHHVTNALQALRSTAPSPASSSPAHARRAHLTQRTSRGNAAQGARANRPATRALEAPPRRAAARRTVGDGVVEPDLLDVGEAPLVVGVAVPAVGLAQRPLGRAHGEAREGLLRRQRQTRLESFKASCSRAHARTHARMQAITHARTRTRTHSRNRSKRGRGRCRTAPCR